MKLHRKINFYFTGDYVCSTNQSKTCRAAKARYLEILERRGANGLGLLESRILKHPEHLKARFS